MKRSIVLMVLMCCAALGAFAIKPTEYLADKLPFIDLDEVVPKAFGDWRAVEQGNLQVINPQAEVLVNTLYQEVLNRVYVNQSGYAIMLSIAYGRDQRDGMDVHKPEVCYPAQGFQLQNVQRVVLNLPDRTIPATRLSTRLGQRAEPVTYWVVLGNQVTSGGMDKKLKEIRYTIVEKILPDGVLVRVSSIDTNTTRAHEIQSKFSEALVGAVDSINRTRFAGVMQKP